MPVERIIAYFSRKLHDVETRYSTYDKELRVRDAIEHWEYYLKSGHRFRVQTDHSALQHILNQPKLTDRQMRLLETLQEYDFDVEHYPGARNYTEDALSRRPDYKKPPIPRTTTQVPQPAQQDADLLPILTSGVQAEEGLDRLRQEYRSCPCFADVLTALEVGIRLQMTAR